MVEKIAVQLYSLREVMAEIGYEAAVRRAAEMGYRGVETAGFPGSSAAEAARLFKALGLQITGAHAPLPLGGQQQEVFDTLAALGSPPLICTQIRPHDVESRDAIARLCDRLNEACAAAAERGIRFGIHNHWWEFLPVDGRLAHHHMLEKLDQRIFFELDTYWIRTAGIDPAEIIRGLGERAPLLHIKDGPAVRDQPMTALGEGVMDIPAVMAAAYVEAWAVVELDRCATDMITALERSYQYLSGLKTRNA